MIEQETSFENITENKDSILRQELEMMSGEFISREISVDYVTEKAMDIHERPEFTPRLSMLQMKALGREEIIFFNEIIFTSNDFLTEVERKLRTGSDDVKAENIESVPKEFKNHFKLSGAELITVETDPLADLDDFRGIDYSEPTTFRVVRPSVVSNMFSEIEKKGRFTVVMKRVNLPNIDNQKLVAFEYRNGSEYTTIDHFIFRSKDK